MAIGDDRETDKGRLYPLTGGVDGFDLSRYGPGGAIRDLQHGSLGVPAEGLIARIVEQEVAKALAAERENAVGEASRNDALREQVFGGIRRELQPLFSVKDDAGEDGEKAEENIRAELKKVVDTLQEKIQYVKSQMERNPPLTHELTGVLEELEDLKSTIENSMEQIIHQVKNGHYPSVEAAISAYSASVQTAVQSAISYASTEVGVALGEYSAEKLEEVLTSSEALPGRSFGNTIAREDNHRHVMHAIDNWMRRGDQQSADKFLGRFYDDDSTTVGQRDKVFERAADKDKTPIDPFHSWHAAINNTNEKSWNAHVKYETEEGNVEVIRDNYLRLVDLKESGLTPEKAKERVDVFDGRMKRYEQGDVKAAIKLNDRIITPDIVHNGALNIYKFKGRERGDEHVSNWSKVELQGAVEKGLITQEQADKYREAIARIKELSRDGKGAATSEDAAEIRRIRQSDDFKAVQEAQDRNPSGNDGKNAQGRLAAVFIDGGMDPDKAWELAKAMPRSQVMEELLKRGKGVESRMLNLGDEKEVEAAQTRREQGQAILGEVLSPDGEYSDLGRLYKDYAQASPGYQKEVGETASLRLKGVGIDPAILQQLANDPKKSPMTAESIEAGRKRYDQLQKMIDIGGKLTPEQEKEYARLTQQSVAMDVMRNSVLNHNGDVARMIQEMHATLPPEERASYDVKKLQTQVDKLLKESPAIKTMIEQELATRNEFREMIANDGKATLAALRHNSDLRGKYGLTAAQLDALEKAHAQGMTGQELADYMYWEVRNDVNTQNRRVLEELQEASAGDKATSEIGTKVGNTVEGIVGKDMADTLRGSWAGDYYYSYRYTSIKRELENPDLTADQRQKLEAGMELIKTRAQAKGAEVSELGSFTYGTVGAFVAGAKKAADWWGGDKEKTAGKDGDRKLGEAAQALKQAQAEKQKAMGELFNAGNDYSLREAALQRLEKANQQIAELSQDTSPTAIADVTPTVSATAQPGSQAVEKTPEQEKAEKAVAQARTPKEKAEAEKAAKAAAGKVVADAGEATKETTPDDEPAAKKGDGKKGEPAAKAKEGKDKKGDGKETKVADAAQEAGKKAKEAGAEGGEKADAGEEKAAPPPKEPKPNDEEKAPSK